MLDKIYIYWEEKQSKPNFPLKEIKFVDLEVNCNHEDVYGQYLIVSLAPSSTELLHDFSCRMFKYLLGVSNNQHPNASIPINEEYKGIIKKTQVGNLSDNVPFYDFVLRCISNIIP